MLEAKHDARLAALRDEFLREAAGPTAAGSVEAALDKNGGWAAERHFRLGKEDRRSLLCKTMLLTLVLFPRGAAGPCPLPYEACFG